MSAEKSPSENGSEAAAKPGKKKLMLIGIGAAAGAFFAGVFDGAEPPPTEQEHADAAPTAPAEPTYWSAPDLVVTLNTNDRKPRYLKLRTTLELTSPADIAKVQSFTPRLIDLCQIYLRELRPDELRGSAAIVRLREELLRRVNLAVSPVVVRNLYFTDMFIE